MGTFKAYFKKEMMESARSYRYLVLAVGILFFAIMEPVMMKLLPVLLKNQVNGEDFAKLFVVSRGSVMQGYIKDIFQIGAIVVIFTMSGMLSEERKSQKFVFPYAKGANPAGIVLAKLLHYSVVISVLVMLGVMVNFYYAGMLIKGASIPMDGVLFVGAMLMLYLVFNMVVALFFSAYLGKGLAAGFVTLGLGYVSNLLGNIESIKPYLPYTLITNANQLKVVSSVHTVVFCVVSAIVLVYLTIRRMNRVEVV